MNDLILLNPDPIFSFVTLRTDQAENYCNMNRNSFVLSHRDPNSGLGKHDIMTAIEKFSGPIYPNDLINSTSRCGDFVLNYKLADLCKVGGSCNCDGKFI